MEKFSDENSLEKTSRRIDVTRMTPREMAEKVTYRDDQGYLYFSAFSIPGCMKEAGVNHKMKGSIKSLKFIVPSAVRTVSDTIYLLDENSNKLTNFEVDSRPVTIPSTKGKIMKHRPRFDKWSAKFQIRLNDDLITVDIAQQLLDEAGDFIGIGDFRPNKGGPFGCFRVSQFKIV